MKFLLGGQGKKNGSNRAGLWQQSKWWFQAGKKSKSKVNNKIVNRPNRQI